MDGVVEGDAVDNEFAAFLKVCPPMPGNVWKTNAEKFELDIQRSFGVAVPTTLMAFWREVGFGFFGEGQLFFFGSPEPACPRESLLDWNKRSFWSDVFPRPSAGGPVFFGETCFGEQIAFRWKGDQCQVLLFIVDTFETFRMADDITLLFSDVFVDPDAIIDHERLAGVAKRLGKLPLGSHFAPILSPQMGGTGDPSNFSVQTPNVHFETEVATYRTVSKMAPGTRISGIDIEWMP
jgi:hypothetical protein